MSSSSSASPWARPCCGATTATPPACPISPRSRWSRASTAACADAAHARCGPPRPQSLRSASKGRRALAAIRSRSSCRRRSRSGGP
eukprot:6779965-Prymnesium_polylepis.1